MRLNANLVLTPPLFCTQLNLESSMSSILPFEKCNYAIIYFTVDESFHAQDVVETSLTVHDYDAFVAGEMVQLRATYDNEEHNVALMQLSNATSAKDLASTVSHLANLKAVKRKSIRRICSEGMVPRFHDITMRSRLRPLTVI